MTYAGAYGRNERVPVDRVLRREGHPLGVRRAEATKAATAEEPEASSNHKRWTLGAAAGALLVAGTFVAGTLGLSGGAAPTAGTAPEHAPAAPGRTPGGGDAPVIGAPTSTQDDQQSTQDQPTQETTPASADPRDGIPVQSNPNAGGSSAGGDSQRTTTPGSSTTTPPATTEPAPDTTTPAPTTPAPEEDGSGLGDVVGDVLDPVTDVVGGILTPSSATTSSTSTPAGPALTLIDPLGDLLTN